MGIASTQKVRSLVAKLSCMEAHGGVQPPVGGGAWRRPPWSTPSGRRPRYRHLLRTRLGLEALFLSSWSGPLFTGTRASWTLADLRPFAIFFTSIAGLAFAYGIAVILTFRRRGRGLVPAWLGLNVNPGARAWFGLAIILPLMIGGVGALYFETGPSPRSQILFTAFYFAPAVIAAGCVLASHACSYRAIKETIVSGNAPIYLMTHDHFWWWDGVQWASTALVAPPQAVQSPDGNYWWTGRDWCALPTFPWRTSQTARGVSARGALG